MAAHAVPQQSGLVPTRLPLVEKSSLMTTVADAAASRALMKEIRSIVAALQREQQGRHNAETT